MVLPTNATFQTCCRRCRKQFDDDSGRVAVVRRVWAPTVGEALQVMVDDRRTDLALERIERAAAEDCETWWND